MRPVPRWLDPWPWRLAGLVLVFLGAAAVLALLTRGVAHSGENSWEGRLVSSVLLTPAPVMGALIASRHRESWYGWVWLILGLGGGLLEFSSGYLAYATAHPGLPAVASIAALSGLAWGTLFLMIPFVLLLFPTGHLPSTKWRPAARLLAGCGMVILVAGTFVPGEVPAGIENPYGLQGTPGAVIETGVLVTTLVVLASAVPAAGSLVFRYRSAAGLERQQIKWFAFSAALFVAMIASDWVWEFEGALEALKEGLPIALLPVAIGVAILRHRLYDVDRIISRTVVYALLTASLVGVYVASVFVLRRFVPWEGELPVAISTLGVAALFNPLRSRLQREVDRRFNRSRYDAVATIEGFSQTVRSEADVPDVGQLLITVAARTMQPEVVGLWLRDSVPMRGAKR